MVRAERELITYVLRHGALYLCDVYTDDEAETPVPMTVIDYVRAELDRDEVTFVHPRVRALWQAACEIRDTRYEADRAASDADLQQRRNTYIQQGQQQICSEGLDMDTIHLREQQLLSEADAAYLAATDEFAGSYIQHRMLRSDDRATVELVARLPG